MTEFDEVLFASKAHMLRELSHDRDALASRVTTLESEILKVTEELNAMSETLKLRPHRQVSFRYKDSVSTLTNSGGITWSVKTLKDLSE